MRNETQSRTSVCVSSGSIALPAHASTGAPGNMNPHHGLNRLILIRLINIPTPVKNSTANCLVSYRLLFSKPRRLCTRSVKRRHTTHNANVKRKGEKQNRGGQFDEHPNWQRRILCTTYKPWISVHVTGTLNHIKTGMGGMFLLSGYFCIRSL